MAGTRRVQEFGDYGQEDDAGFGDRMLLVGFHVDVY